MKGKWKITAWILCAVLLAGCQKTPENQIVRQKGEDSIGTYREAGEREGNAGTGETSKADETNGADASGTEETAGAADTKEQDEENPLRQRLQVPQKYTAEDASDDGTYSLTADAEIQVPTVEQVGVYQVSIRQDAQEAVDQIQNAFFGDAPVYDGEKYFQMTKGEIQKKLEELKGYQAAGNLDPYGYREAYQETGNGSDDPEMLDEIYNIQDDIDSWQALYEDAPEEKEKVKVHPELSLSEEDQAMGFTAGSFNGAVETEEAVYQVQYSEKNASDRVYARIQRLSQDGTASGWWNGGMYDAYASGDGPDYPTEEEAKKMAGISEEDAIALGNSYVEKLGDAGFTLGAAQLALYGRENDGNRDTMVYEDGGYELDYVRAVDGFPVTYEMNYGGGLENMDSVNETSGYERLTIVVNSQGLQYAEMANWYTVGEKTINDVEMLSFPEIASIFQQMMKIKNQDTGGVVLGQDYQVRRVTLGYMRIYDPGKSVTEGLLVPVWDFFGMWTTTYTDEGEEKTGVNGSPYQSLMTINAIDGTVIDRGLGY